MKLASVYMAFKVAVNTLHIVLFAPHTHIVYLSPFLIQTARIIFNRLVEYNSGAILYLEGLCRKRGQS